MGLSDFRAPAASTAEDSRAAWAREVVQSGLAWIKSQRAYSSIKESRALILDSASPDLVAGQSAVNVPRTKRDIKELVSIFANLKPTASNRTDNEQFYDQADILNKLDRWMWTETQMDRAFRKAFQAAAVTGTAYVSHVYDADLLGKGRGGIRTDVYDAEEVYLINPPKNYDIQKTYAVVQCQRVPIHLVQAKYPLRAHEIVPDHGVQAYTQQGLEYVQQFMSSPLRHLSGKFDQDGSKLDDVFPTCDIYEISIMDGSINMTGRDVMMGDFGTSWSYKVPSYGSMIPTGTNTWEGLPNFRRATVDDARLYPTRRKIVTNGKVILYDGPQEWWYPGVPLTKFSFDDWWCEALGFPLSRDTQSIEHASNELLRGMVDGANVALDPPLTYDENVVSDRLAKTVNPRQRGQRLKLNTTMGDAVKPLLPNGYSNLPNFIPDLVKYLGEQADFIIGRADVMAIAKARQVPSSDTLEKIQELAGPLAQDMTRSMESAMHDLGEMRRWLIFQFVPKKRRLQILGDNGLTTEDFDFDPGLLIPSHMDGEDPKAGESRYTLYERARAHCAQFEYRVVPNSMARLTQSTQKLMLSILQKQGFPLDPWTVSDLYEIDNFGPPPRGTKNIFERWVAWQHIQRELAEEMGAGQQPAPRGRPNSGNKPPRIRLKDGGTRTTVSTSG